MRSVVVLPQPDGPSKPKNSPRSTAIETLTTAGVVPKRLDTELRERSGIVNLWSALTCQRFDARLLVAARPATAACNWPRQVAELESGNKLPHSKVAEIRYLTSRSATTGT